MSPRVHSPRLACAQQPLHCSLPLGSPAAVLGRLAPHPNLTPTPSPSVFDSSRGFLKQPFQFQIGAGDVIRGWDQASACSSHPLAGTAPARCSASMGITRTRVRSRPPALGAGHAEDEQGREGDSHMHARLRMYARAHRTKRGPPCTRPTHPRRDNACRYLARQTASAARRPTSRPARPWSSTSSSLASAESPSSEPAGQTAGAQPRARRTCRVWCKTCVRG